MNDNIKSIPTHIGIIMDGNGRWATQRHESRAFGHGRGIDAVNEVINGSLIKGVKYLTLYTFSTENNNRPKDEVFDLINLIISSLNTNIQNLMDNKVRLRVIGDLSCLDSFVADCFNYCIELTAPNDNMDLIIAMNYSSRDEITRAIKHIADDVKRNVLSVDEINESIVSQYLDTRDIPDPDLIIRTGGEYRLSNFMLWQASYSEMIFSDILWPDYTREDLYKAIDDYMHRDRRFGKLSKNE